MQKTKAKLPMLVIIVTVIVACFLRFFQLLRYTDEATGLVFQNDSISYIIYGLLFLILVISIVSGILNPKQCNAIHLQQGNKVWIVAFMSAVGLFVDFVAQCYDLYEYCQNTRYMESAYVIPTIVSGLFGLVSCFYFIAVYKTAKGYNFDFKKFTRLHFAPIVWAVSRVISITTKFVDIKSGIEISCEFFFLVSFIFFWFGFILSLEEENKGKNLMFTVSSLLSLALSIIIFIPRAVYTLTNAKGFFYGVGASAFGYILLGIFAVVVTSDKINNDDNIM